jgi:RNHCP domain
MRYNGTRSSEQGFICVQCHLYVSCALDVAGVQNRNHCPSCLWSRHLDWHNAGDRLSVCRSAMRPVGLTTKRGRNKYARERDGELMIIHQCTACEKVVINRIAADDSAAALLVLFEGSYETSAAFQAELDTSGVSILTAHDSDLVRRRLFGNSSMKL